MNVADRRTAARSGITINFDFLVSKFSAYFTYLAPLTLEAFDASNNLLGSVNSAFSNNLACLAGPPCSGDLGSNPNELLHLSFANMASVTIAGDPLGGSFAMDDVNVSVPEPPTILLLGIALGLSGIKLRRRYPQLRV